MKTLWLNYRAWFESKRNTAIYVAVTIIGLMLGNYLSTRSEWGCYTTLAVMMAVLLSPFFIRRRKATAILLILALGTTQIKAQEQEAEAGNQGEKVSVLVGLICLAGGVTGGVYLYRKCSQWFAPKPPPTNAPPEGIWRSDTNDYPKCDSCFGDPPEVTGTNATPFAFSFSVKENRVSPVSVGVTNGTVVTVGDMGYTVALNKDKNETSVLVEWTDNLEKPDWKPFVIVKLDERQAVTIYDPIGSATGFYRMSVLAH